MIMLLLDLLGAAPLKYDATTPVARSSCQLRLRPRLDALGAHGYRGLRRLAADYDAEERDPEPANVSDSGRTRVRVQRM
jgi:hypothetical protein